MRHQLAFVFAAFYFVVYLYCLYWGMWASGNLPALQWKRNMLPMFFVGLASGVLAVAEVWYGCSLMGAMARCPDGELCTREREWGHPCDRDEHGRYECERIVT